MSPTTARLIPRAEDDGPGLSKQNVIIIAVCASCGGLALAFMLWRMIRNCRRSTPSKPLPPPQPLAHHREHKIAQMEESKRLSTWSDPQYHVISPLRSPPSTKNSKSSLLGSEPLSPPPSIPPSAEDPRNTIALSETNARYLPPPNASFHLDRPGSRSSLVSNSDTSCVTAPTTPDSSNLVFGRTNAGSPAPPSARRARPLSMSSTSTHYTMSSRRGVPHAPYNQIQIVLPTPLASANNSRDTLTLPRSRLASEAGNGSRPQSIADPWINLSHGSPDVDQALEAKLAAVARRRHASLVLQPSTGLQDGAPPPLATHLEGKDEPRVLERRRPLTAEA